jgi:hypothetical protein
MRHYEILFYRPQGSCSAWYFLQCASDRQAMAVAGSMLTEALPTASVWQDERRVGDVSHAPLAGPWRYQKAPAAAVCSQIPDFASQ